MDTNVDGVFLTQFNFKKVIPENLPDYDGYTVENVVAYNRIKNIFNESELFQFVKLWAVLKDPNILLKFYAGISEHAKPEAYSSYHHDRNCLELHKWYLDYTIDSRNKKLREDISNKVRYAFRDYTYSNDYPSEGIRFDFINNTVSVISDGRLLGNIPNDLFNELNSVKNKYPNELGHIFDLYPNSGIHAYQNYSLEDIEKHINQLISSSEAYRSSDPFLAKKIDNITYADIARLKKMDNVNAKKWVSEFKEPLFSAISNYYWIKFNPELTVSKTVLDSIGFKPCRRCIKN